jgi:hypothetical protein
MDPSGHIPVDSLAWEYNQKINEQKFKWAEANKNHDKAGKKASDQISNRLRGKVFGLRQQELNGKMGPIYMGDILGGNDKALAYHDLVNDDGTVVKIATSSTGTVFYEADPKYTYWEQVHTPTVTEEWHGKIAKALFGFYAGGYLTMGKGWAIQLFSGGTGAVLTDNLLGSAPDSSVTKTMIYRTDRKTGQIENMIIDTNGYLPISVRPWQVYK